MSDEEDKVVGPTPEQPLKKKKSAEKAEDKQASWADHKQAELGEIPDRIKEWFENTKVGQMYKEARESFKEEIKQGLQSGFGLAGERGEKTPDAPQPEPNKNSQEDEEALAPMNSAEKASSPIPEANLNKLDDLNKPTPGTEPSPNAPLVEETDIKKL